MVKFVVICCSGPFWVKFLDGSCSVIFACNEIPFQVLVRGFSGYFFDNVPRRVMFGYCCVIFCQHSKTGADRALIRLLLF